MSEIIKAEPEVANLSKGEQLEKAVTIDSCFDLAYLNMVMMEGLRFQPPGGLTPVVFN